MASMKKRKTKGARHPFKLDVNPLTVRLPIRLLMGTGGERTRRGEWLPVRPLRDVTRVVSVDIANAVIARRTDGRLRGIPARSLAWDEQTGTWWLILDF